MYSILEQLFDVPIGSNSIQPGANQELMEKRKAVNQCLKRLQDTLSEEQKKLLEAYQEADGDVANYQEFKKFKYGFELAMFLMMELMEDYENMKC